MRTSPPTPSRRSRLVLTLWLAVSVLTLACARPVDIQTSATEAAGNPPVGWWRTATFYEVFVRSFADSAHGPLANDGIGDLQGLIDHLDYLNDGRGAAGHSLGVTALWLMPIQPSPSYHGYDVTNYRNVNPQYGDLATMRRLVREAHRRGIRVIIDLVLNHCSSEYPLFQLALHGGDSPQTKAARAMFRFAALPEQLYGPWGARAWHPGGGGFYYGVFSPEMPDWNLRNPAVTAHHYDVAKFWLRDVGVDGFRLDAVRYLIETGDKLQDTTATRRWLQGFTAYCHSIKPGAFVVGENTSDMREVSQWIRRGALDSSFEFDLARATLQSIRLRTPGILEQALQRLDELYDGDSPWSSIIDNHDEVRVLTQLGGDRKKARLAAELLFTEPGVPFVYYGEELGMSGAKPDPELRTPFPWTPQQPNAGFTAPGVKPWHPLTGDVVRFNVATEEAEPGSMLQLYRRLIRLHADSPALQHGRLVPVQTNDHGCLVEMRDTADDAVLVLANYAATPRPGPVVSIASSWIRPGWVPQELLQGARVTPPTLAIDGGFSGWRPLPQLAPETVYVIRWHAR